VANHVPLGGRFKYHHAAATDVDGNTETEEPNLPSTALNPADFSTENLIISPIQTMVGESVTISVDVTNTGEIEGSHILTLKINYSKKKEI
jgi:hypothetical protein